jgi:hypothetical protein
MKTGFLTPFVTLDLQIKCVNNIFPGNKLTEPMGIVLPLFCLSKTS